MTNQQTETPDPWPAGTWTEPYEHCDRLRSDLLETVRIWADDQLEEIAAAPEHAYPVTEADGFSADILLYAREAIGAVCAQVLAERQAVVAVDKLGPIGFGVVTRLVDLSDAVEARPCCDGCNHQPKETRP